MKKNLAVYFILILTAALAFAACGGSDGAVILPGGGNTAPVADAGLNRTVPEKAKVTLNGLGSYDADGDTLTYSWVLVPPLSSSATLSDQTAAKPSFTADVPGDYLATLIVNDSTADSSAATVTISTDSAMKLSFVTSTTGVGNLSTWADAGGSTGLAAGDAICQARAAAAGLSGTFVAWISNSTDDAYCRANGLTGKKSANCGEASLPDAAGPWMRTDGYPFGDTIGNMVSSGMIYSPASYNENGSKVASGYYFTATNVTGAADNYTYCSEWTAADSSYATTGTTTGTSNTWTSAGSRFCSSSTARLLCLELTPGPAVPARAPGGNKVFITSTVGGGDLGSWADAGGKTGLAAGDAICQARASTAGLVNSANYKAWISDSSSDAKDRIVNDGPWSRIDGMPVADNKADLLDGELFTSINVDETGSYVAWWGPVMTATGSGGLRHADTCSDWTDGTATGKVRAGDATSVINWTQYFYSSNCNQNSSTMRLYCFEDSP